jgi:ribosomal protein L7/L12
MQNTAIILFVILPFVGLVTLIRSVAASIERKLDRVNAKLDLIAKANNIDVNPPSHFSQRVQTALADGRKIEAIKLYRQETGVGLRDAKEAIERKML